MERFFKILANDAYLANSLPDLAKQSVKKSFTKTVHCKRLINFKILVFYKLSTMTEDFGSLQRLDIQFTVDNVFDLLISTKSDKRSSLWFLLSKIN